MSPSNRRRAKPAALGVRNGYRLNVKEKLWTTVRVRCGQKKEEPECA